MVIIMGRLQSEAESLEEVGLHNQNDNVQIEDSDEDEFEIAQEKAGYFKPVLFIVLILLAIAIFATRSKSIDSNFVAVPSAYLSTLFNQRPSSILQLWLDPRQPYLSILIPVQTFPPPTCPKIWSPKCGFSNLKTQGFMVHELQSWLLAHLNGSEKILVVWREDLAVSILLMSKQMKKDMEVSDSPNAEIMVIVTTKDAQSPQFQALRLTLAKEDTLSVVSFAETDQWVLPQNMAQYQLVIGSGSLLHANLIEPNLRESDPLDPTVQEEVGTAVFDAISKTRLLLLYNGSPNEEEINEFSMVKNEVIKLLPNNSVGFMEERVRTSTQLSFGTGLGLLLLNPILSIPIQIERQNTPTDQKPAEYPTQPYIDSQLEHQSKEPENKKEQANSDLQIQTKWKYQLMTVPTIRRLQRPQMAQILNCSEPDNPDYVLYGNFIRTHLQRIEIEREDKIYGDELIDVTHVAKFFVDYFLTTGPSNVLCASDSSLLTNLLALSNPLGNLFLYDAVRNTQLLKRGLAHNRLSGHLHWALSKDFDLINFLKVEEIRLVAVDNHFIDDWRLSLVLALQNQIQLLFKKQEGLGQTKQVENLAKLGGLHIYVIYPREDRSFDLGCLRDYEFELFVDDVKYPHNTFFLISRQELSAQSVDPSNGLEPAHRLVTIDSYPCASPPYQRAKKDLQKGLILMRSRYDLIVPVDPGSQTLFKKQGAQEIGLLELLRSSLTETDRVLLYADASSNPLLPLIVMRIVGDRGKFSITNMTKKQTEMLQLSLQSNDLPEKFQATEVSVSDPRSLKKLFLQLKPTVVITKPDLLQRDQEIFRNMPAGSMILFKYANQDYFFEGYLASLSQQQKLHEIYYDPRIDKTNLCNDFRLRSLTAANIAKHEFGWFVIQL